MTRAPLTQRKAAAVKQPRDELRPIASLAKGELRQKRPEAASAEDRPLRPIVPVSLAAGPTSPAVVPARLAGQKTPRIEWVAPGSLFVEEGYQRQLSRNSLTLIRKIVGGWNWAHVKPPVVAPASDELEKRRDGASPASSAKRYVVIDGQHTAIAAVTHGGIEKLPVVVVEPGAVDRRAAAFIAHNRDRLHLTPMQMHYAALAAGDESARAVNAACLLAGAHICRVQPAEWKPGDTVAVSAIAAAVKEKGVDAAAAALTVLVDAGRAPVSANEIKALMALLHDPARPCETVAIAEVVKSDSGGTWARLAASIAIERDLQHWRALADLWRAQLAGAPIRVDPALSGSSRITPTSSGAESDSAAGGAAEPAAPPRAANGGGIEKHSRPAAAPAAPPPRLPKVEAEVLAALANGPAGLETLIRRTAYPGSAVATALAALRASGKVGQTGELFRRRS